MTRKIYDFSPEQEQNLLAIVWLYRGETRRYLDLVAGYCQRMLTEGAACFTMKDDEGETVEPLPDFIGALATLRGAIEPFIKTLAKDAPHVEPHEELDDAIPLFKTDVEAFRKTVNEQQTAWGQQKTANGELKKAVDRLATLAETSRDLVKQTDLLYKLACRLIETCEEDFLLSSGDLLVVMTDLVNTAPMLGGAFMIKEWFVHLRFPGHENTQSIDGVPEGWEKKPLGSIAPLKYGKALKNDDRIPGPFPVYGSSGVVGTHTKAFIPGPTIIVGRKGNVDSVYWSPDDCHPIDTVYYIDAGNCSFFLYYALQQMTFISTDVAVPGLNRDFAHSRSLLVPDQKILPQDAKNPAKGYGTMVAGKVWHWYERWVDEVRKHCRDSEGRYS